MSIIIKDSKGIIRCICKGADSALFPLLAMNSKENEEIQPITGQYLEDYAKEGLRTLLICDKIISPKEYEEWNSLYLEACLAIADREQKIEKVAEMIEKNFVLIGSTAIEDRLQEGVGETIQSFKDAGIKVWVLTGDKVETAIYIGYSCKLLNNEMSQIMVTSNTSREVYESLIEGRK